MEGGSSGTGDMGAGGMVEGPGVVGGACLAWAFADAFWISLSREPTRTTTDLVQRTPRHNYDPPAHACTSA